MMMYHCSVFILRSQRAKIIWQMLLFWGIGLLCFVATPVHAQPAPPRLVKDINQSTGNSKPDHFTSVGNTLYFVADDGLHGRELWKTDGSANGTMLVKDIVPGLGDSAPDALFAFNGVLFFNAKDTNGDTELWRSDGTATGTVRVKDINPTASSVPHEFVTLNQNLYFVADDGVHGAVLWRSDGTEANTTLVKDLYPNNPSVDISSLTVVNGSILLIVYDPIGQVYGFWRSDGTTNGTTWLKDINLADARDLFVEHTVLNNTLYFVTKDNLGKLYLWKSDATAAGTVLVTQIAPPGGIYDLVYSFTVMDNVLYFMASEGANCGVWKSNGTAAGTTLVTSACVHSSLVSVNHVLYFTGADADTGTELWRSDGTPTGSAPVKDIAPGADSSFPSIGANVGGVLYFFADDQTQHGLWRSDGTAAGTTLVKKLDWGGVNLSISNFVPFAFYNWNGIAYFSAEDGQLRPDNDSQAGYEPWKSDGTAAGTTLVKDINALTNSSYPGQLTMVGDVLYFLARDPVNAQELWKSTGTSASTTLLSDINPNGIGARIQKVVGGAHIVYLQVYNDPDSEVWRSDGTVAGTFRLKTFPNIETTRILAMTTDGDTLYFVVSETGVGWTLWKSDGTAAGTVPVTLLTTTGVSTIQFLLAHNGVVYFTLAQNVGNQLQYQWWRSDGTAVGTSDRRVSKKVGNEPDRNRFTIGKAAFEHIKADAKNTEIPALMAVNQGAAPLFDGLRTETNDGEIEHGNRQGQARKPQKVLQAGSC